MKSQGKCNCGEVSFEIDTLVSDVYICHCSICRRSTGGSGIAVCIVDKDNFYWIKGQKNIGIWCKPDHDWQSSFCISCGSPLPRENDAKSMAFPTSLLISGTENLQVKHHLFVDSKASWEIIGDSGKQHKKNFNE